MVGHYADVARLVGLTENELYTQLKNIKQHANLSKFFVHNKFLKGSPAILFLKSMSERDGSDLERF